MLWLLSPAKIVVSLVALTGVAGTAYLFTTTGPLSDEDPQDPAESSQDTVTPVPAGSARVATIAGVPSVPDAASQHFEDGPAASARFDGPTGVAIGPDGTLYVADFENRKIRKISPTGTVTTLAGSGETGLQDGVGTSAQFAGPVGIAVDEQGVVYVTDSPSHRIRRITPEGTVVTVAGSGPAGIAEGGFKDGPALEAQFKQPAGLALQPDGSLVIADTANNRLRLLTLDGEVRTLAGDGTAFASTDGPVDRAKLWFPVGVAIGQDGAVFFTEHGSNSVRKLAEGFVTTVVSSSGPFTYEGQPTGATLGFPAGIVVLSDGTVIVSNTQLHEVIAITPDGGITRLAGGAGAGAEDGSGDAARFRSPTGLTADAAGVIYVADNGNDLIRSITR
ncbi:MAG: hypothetical protein ACRDHF_00980 [Tepidiformaceae bacterium]